MMINPYNRFGDISSKSPIPREMRGRIAAHVIHQVASHLSPEMFSNRKILATFTYARNELARMYKENMDVFPSSVWEDLKQIEANLNEYNKQHSYDYRKLDYHYKNKDIEQTHKNQTEQEAQELVTHVFNTIYEDSQTQNKQRDTYDALDVPTILSTLQNYGAEIEQLELPTTQEDHSPSEQQQEQLKSSSTSPKSIANEELDDELTMRTLGFREMSNGEESHSKKVSEQPVSFASKESEKGQIKDDSMLKDFRQASDVEMPPTKDRVKDPSTKEEENI